MAYTIQRKDRAYVVVDDGLGHANVAFTMHTHQHLLPGMSAAAARQFAALLAAHSR